MTASRAILIAGVLLLAPGAAVSGVLLAVDLAHRIGDWQSWWRVGRLDAVYRVLQVVIGAVMALAVAVLPVSLWVRAVRGGVPAPAVQTRGKYVYWGQGLGGRAGARAGRARKRKTTSPAACAPNAVGLPVAETHVSQAAGPSV